MTAGSAAPTCPWPFPEPGRRAGVCWLAGTLGFCGRDLALRRESEGTRGTRSQRGLCALGWRRLTPLWLLGENEFHSWRTTEPSGLQLPSKAPLLVGQGEGGGEGHQSQQGPGPGRPPPAQGQSPPLSRLRASLGLSWPSVSPTPCLSVLMLSLLLSWAGRGPLAPGLCPVCSWPWRLESRVSPGQEFFCWPSADSIPPLATSLPLLLSRLQEAPNAHAATPQTGTAPSLPPRPEAPASER